MYTYEDRENLLEHITVRNHYKKDEHVQIQLIAHDGYVLKLKDDNGYTDEDGIYVEPSLSQVVFGGTWLDINSYEAKRVGE